MTAPFWNSNTLAQQADALQKYEVDCRRQLSDVDERLQQERQALDRMEKAASQLRTLCKSGSASTLDKHLNDTAISALDGVDAVISVKKQVVAALEQTREVRAAILDIVRSYGDLPAPMPFESTFRLALDKGLDPEVAAAAAAEAERVEGMTPQEQAQHEIKKAYRNGYKVLG